MDINMDENATLMERMGRGSFELEGKAGRMIEFK